MKNKLIYKSSKVYYSKANISLDLILLQKGNEFQLYPSLPSIFKNPCWIRYTSYVELLESLIIIRSYSEKLKNIKGMLECFESRILFMSSSFCIKTHISILKRHTFWYVSNSTSLAKFKAKPPKVLLTVWVI